MLAPQVLRGQQCDDPGPALDRGLNALHEITVRKVPLLQRDRIARRFEDRADFGRDGGVGLGPAHENLAGFAHGAFRCSMMLQSNFALVRVAPFDVR
jgi:hypothetical protein